MKQKDAIELLMNCYFDGMTLAQALSFIQRCYWERPSDKAIEAAKKAVREQCNQEWKLM